MLYGAGQLLLLSRDLDIDSLIGQNIVYPAAIASFELTFDDKLAEAKALIDGKRQIVAAAITEQTATLKLSFEYNDWQTLQFAYDELAQVTPTVNIPTLKSKRINTNNQFVFAETITASDYTAGKNFHAYVAEPGKSPLGVNVDRGFLPVADYTITGTGVNLIADAYINRIVQVAYDKTYTDIETIGVGDDYDSWGRLVFSGVLIGTEYQKRGIQIIVPQLSRIKSPSIAVTGDMVKLDIEFRASVPAGNRKPFQLYNLERHVGITGGTTKVGTAAVPILNT